MPSIRITTCRLTLSRRVATHEAPNLRDFFGNALADEVQRTCYGDDGRPLFEYPRLQFKMIESTAILLGIAEGADLLERLRPHLDEATLGDEQNSVSDMNFETHEDEIDVSSEPIEYRFLNPWLGLNQKNFRAYVGSRNQGFRKDELSRILAGNCLGLVKSLGMQFRDWIEADGRHLTSIKTTVNREGAIGFIGRFQVNLQLPDYLGLGRHVPRGFGTISSR